MSFDDKRSWVYLAVVTATYFGYLTVVLVRGRSAPLIEVAYGWLLVGSIGAAIVLTVAASIVVAIVTRDEGKTDERDERINRRGELIGFTVFSMGALGALLLTIFEVAHFWIGNAIYLSFVVSAQTSTIVKLVTYRRGLASW